MVSKVSPITQVLLKCGLDANRMGLVIPFLVQLAWDASADRDSGSDAVRASSRDAHLELLVAPSRLPQSINSNRSHPHGLAEFPVIDQH